MAVKLSESTITAMKELYFGRNLVVPICDLETMSTFEGGMMLSMGMVAADITKEYTFHELVNMGIERKYSVKEQKHRHVQQTTVEWWKKQGAEASRVLSRLPTDLPYTEVIEHVREYIVGKDISSYTLWFSRGPIDYYIMRHIHCFDNGQAEESLPWKFWNLRDSRSFLHGLGIRAGKIDLPNGILDGFVEHNALHDCAADFLRLQYALEMVYGDNSNA